MKKYLMFVALPILGLAIAFCVLAIIFTVIQSFFQDPQPRHDDEDSPPDTEVSQ